MVIRVDGRGFSKLTRHYEKPFDNSFHNLMTRVGYRIMEEFSPCYCHTHSDEIYVVFNTAWDMFDREVEKIVSKTAGFASAVYTANSATLGTFDSRIWMGPSLEDVVDYFSWRQADAWRNCIQGYCYWTLRKNGYSKGQATNIMKNRNMSWLNESLFKHGININETTTWHRRGTAFYWETYEKEGYNPQKNETVTAFRRQIKMDEGLPMREGYRDLICSILVD